MDRSVVMIYTVRTKIEPEYEDEFNEWQFEEHIPWVLSVPGYLNVRRFIDLGGPHRYMNLWQIESIEAHDCEEHHQKSVTPWSRRLKRYRQMDINYYRHAFPKETSGDDVTCTEELACMVIDRFSVAAKAKPDLYSWYEENYLPQVADLPGVIGVRGFELIRGSKNYMILHYLSKNEVDMTRDWRKWRTVAKQKWSIAGSESYRPMSPIFFSNAYQRPKT